MLRKQSMSKGSKSRPQSTQPNGFRTGNMLSHPSGEKIFKEQSKILQEKQKKEKDLWMLNTKPQFMNGPKQEQGEGEEDHSDTDIDSDSNTPKPKPTVIERVIKYRNGFKRIKITIPLKRQGDSQSDITSEQEESQKKNIFKPKSQKKMKDQERKNSLKPQAIINNVKKEQQIKRTQNQNEQVKVEERRKSIIRTKTSQKKSKFGQHQAATQKKVVRFQDDNDGCKPGYDEPHNKGENFDCRSRKRIPSIYIEQPYVEQEEEDNLQQQINLQNFRIFHNQFMTQSTLSTQSDILTVREAQFVKQIIILTNKYSEKKLPSLQQYQALIKNLGKDFQFKIFEKTDYYNYRKRCCDKINSFLKKVRK